MPGAEMVVFASENEAEEAYFAGRSGPMSDVDNNPGDGWQQPETINELEGAWVLLQQVRLGVEGEDRYFVAGGPEGWQFLEAGGNATTPPEDASFDEVPSFDTEDEARAAHAAWLEDNPEYAGSEGDDHSWTDWEKMDEDPPWHVYAREREDSGALQAVINGIFELDDGDEMEVYLAPDAQIIEEPHVYTNFDDVDAALAAYAAAVESGDIPEDQQPTGADPGVGGIEAAVPEPDDSGPFGGGAGGIVSTVASNPLLLVAIVVVAYLLYRRYQAGDGAPDPSEIGPGGGPEI